MSDILLRAADRANIEVYQPKLEWAKPLALSYEEITWMILHHDAWPGGTPEKIHADHIAKGYRGAGYGARISQKSVLEILRGYGYIGAHCKQSHMNFISFGLCFEGNFDDHNMPLTQFKTGVNLIREILNDPECKIPQNHVAPHRLYTDTSCPGENFPLSDMLSEIARRTQKPHWGDVPFEKLNQAGVIVREKRYDDPITRAEAMALVWQMLDWFINMEVEQMEYEFEKLEEFNKLLS